MSDEEVATTAATPSGVDWEGFAKLLTLAAIFVPLIGAIYAELAFALTGRIYLGVAALRPIPVLATVGALIVIPVLPLLALPALDRIGDRHSRFHISGRVRLAVAVVVIGAYILLAAFPIGIGAAFVTVILVVWTRHLRRSQKLTVAQLLPMVAFVAIAVGAISGLVPSSAHGPAVDVAFRSDAGLPSGAFSFLAQTPESFYLLPCDGGDMWIANQADVVAVRGIDTPAVARPNLLELLGGAQLQLGFVQSCPAH